MTTAVTTVEVIAKLRPPTKADLGYVEITGPGRCRVDKCNFEFDSISPPGIGNEEFYERHIAPAIYQGTEGFNTCVLCYGFTGGGKTYTMFGDDTVPGIGHHAVRSLLETPGQQDLHVQLVQVYMEKVYDLLDPANQDIRVLGEGLYGATERMIKTPDQFAKVARIALSHRQTASTGVNAQSSRSHCVIVLRVRVRHDENLNETRGNVYLVDLAGCERQNETQSEGQTLRESQSINKSVFAINKVVLACSSNSAHIPYRDSKITMVLHDAFGGNSKTLVVLCCDGSKPNETVNVLRFGSRCKLIRNVVLATIDEDDPRDRLIAEMREELEALRRELHALKFNANFLENSMTVGSLDVIDDDGEADSDADGEADGNTDTDADGEADADAVQKTEEIFAAVQAARPAQHYIEEKKKKSFCCSG